MFFYRRLLNPLSGLSNQLFEIRFELLWRLSVECLCSGGIPSQVSSFCYFNGIICLFLQFNAFELLATIEQSIKIELNVKLTTDSASDIPR